MKDKEKQIEEMAYIIENAFKVYFGANDLVEPEDFPYQAKDLAKELLEHYQVVDKDSVVLSREEFDKLGIAIETIQEWETQNGQPKLVKEKKTVKRIPLDIREIQMEEMKGTIKQLSNKVEMYQRLLDEMGDKLGLIRKETVEKILFDLVGHTFECDGWTYTVDVDDVKWLADKYKVEIKE